MPLSECIKSPLTVPAAAAVAAAAAAAEAAVAAAAVTMAAQDADAHFGRSISITSIFISVLEKTYLRINLFDRLSCILRHICSTKNDLLVGSVIFF